MDKPLGERPVMLIPRMQFCAKTDLAQANRISGSPTDQILESKSLFELICFGAWVAHEALIVQLFGDLHNHGQSQ